MTPPAPTLPRLRCDSAAAREIAAEHGALIRQMAILQRRVGEQLRAHALQVALLQDEVLFLRAQLVMDRTCLLWGLGVATGVRPMPRRAREAVTAPMETMAEASSVICQAGCVGHAHPWLETDGRCRRTGQACDRLVEGADRDRIPAMNNLLKLNT